MSLSRLFSLRGRSESRDGGFSVVEALAAMLLVSLITAAFTTSAVGLRKTQDNMQRLDVAVQVARGVLEKAKSTTWSNLGLCPDDAGYRSEVSANGSTEDTAVTSACSSDGRIRPLSTETVRGTEVEVRTDITMTTTTGGLPAKRVTVTTDHSKSRGGSSSSIYELILDAPLDQQIPAGIPTVPEVN